MHHFHVTGLYYCYMKMMIKLECIELTWINTLFDPQAHTRAQYFFSRDAIQFTDLAYSSMIA